MVWDLDNTVWEGVLLEKGAARLRRGVKETMVALDQRGVLHSIASRNNRRQAMARLAELGLQEMFLFPEINWGAKSESLRRIQKNLNIGFDTILFLDDDPFEREEVTASLPDVRTCDPLQHEDSRSLLELPCLKPRFITDDSRRRRKMYQEAIARGHAEENFEGPKEEFLSGLGMKVSITPADANDLARAEELTIRTNQLNATGRTYSYAELDQFRTSDAHSLLVCEMADRFGSYGKIGLALIERSDAAWILKLLLMSCRVMSRGVGTIFLNYILAEAKRSGKRLLAEFVPTDRNRMMYVTYKFANFSEVEKRSDGSVVLENDLSKIKPIPPYVEIVVSPI